MIHESMNRGLARKGWPKARQSPSFGAFLDPPPMAFARLAGPEGPLALGLTSRLRCLRPNEGEETAIQVRPDGRSSSGSLMALRLSTLGV